VPLVSSAGQLVVMAAPQVNAKPLARSRPDRVRVDGMVCLSATPMRQASVEVVRFPCSRAASPQVSTAQGRPLQPGVRLAGSPGLRAPKALPRALAGSSMVEPGIHRSALVSFADVPAIDGKRPAPARRSSGAPGAQAPCSPHRGNVGARRCHLPGIPPKARRVRRG
jgi:hypothetical protein